MRQIIQDLKSGRTEVVEVPCPRVRPGHVLIRTGASLVSAGTERMLVEFGRAGWMGKARQQPGKMREVLAKMQTDGLLATVDAVNNKLNRPISMGYSNVGTVLAIGAGVTGFAVGQRVVSNGNHAEIVCVAENLCARVPDGVVDDAAVFAIVGAVALQGIRLAQPTLGEAVVVTGLGLIGLLTVALLRAQGCRVIGLDFDRQRLALAARYGAEVIDLSEGEDVLGAAHSFSRGRGIDAVIVTASTSSNEPMRQAAQMCRKRGRIVLVGTAGLEWSRADFYEKELSFQVSCSYGPGRYDPAYEEKGRDYPVGFVRWTAQRNFEAFLDMLADGRVEVDSLISHRFPLDRAEDVYNLILGGAPSLGVVLEYAPPAVRPDASLLTDEVPVAGVHIPATVGGGVGIGVIGAGSHATGVLIPALKAGGAQLITVASITGVTGFLAARRYGFEKTTTNTDDVFMDDRIRAVVIATRHGSHASLVCSALRAGKHVYVEKPLGLDSEELAAIAAAYAEATPPTPVLMVGFNRRFAPLVSKMAGLLRRVTEPMALIMTVNAGAVPPATGRRILRPAAGGSLVKPATTSTCCGSLRAHPLLPATFARWAELQPVRRGSTG